MSFYHFKIDSTITYNLILKKKILDFWIKYEFKEFIFLFVSY